MRLSVTPKITARGLLMTLLVVNMSSCQSYVPVLPQAALAPEKAGNTPTHNAAEMTLSDLPPQNLRVPRRVARVPKNQFDMIALETTRGLAPLSTLPLPAPNVDDCHSETVTDQSISTRKRQRLSRYELLHDGGDHRPKARLQPDWRLLGIDAEDTIVHFDTLGGRTEVSASNRVSIYAPRFAATRQINNAHQYETVEPAGHVRIMAEPHESDLHKLAENVTQRVATVREIGGTVPQAVQDRQRGLNIEQTDVPTMMLRKLLPFENREIIRTGVYDASEAVYVEKYAQAAQTWTETQAVQVVLDNQPASILARTTAANEAFEYALPDGKPRVRIVKLASTSYAHAGEVVRFTLRFDNVGDEAVGNVTIIDNLTTRLEYVDDSQECSLIAVFSATDNQGQSSLLRWEIADPLEPGDGGVIRFACRVR